MGSAWGKIEPTLREALQELSEFTYSPLPSVSSIRLLEISPDKPDPKERDKSCGGGYTKDVVVCTLHLIDLDDLENPTSYDALSYTWGNPFSIFRSQEDAAKADILYATKGLIVCNGMVLQIGRNLYDALLSLRMARRSKCALNNLSPDLKCRPLVQQLIWIDAICINQGNLLERNSQVQIMDRIYRTAETVHIWLGPHDDFSMPAIGVIEALAKAPSGSTERLELSYDLESSQYEELGIEQLKPADWRCLFAFLERRWFRRAWIVQEVAFSNFGLVNVGSVYFAWSKLVSATGYLQASLTISTIWNNGIKITSGFFNPPTSMYLATEVISASQILEINPLTIIHLIANTRASLGIVDPLTHYSKLPKPLSCLEILARFRASQCRDPRDRVYAFLSLWPEVLEPKPIPKRLLVDYSRTVAQVYTDAAWAILKSSENLGILSHVSKGEGARTPGLPSWVPDWSCGTSFQAFENLLRVKKGRDNSNVECPYNASGDHIWQMACSSNENPNLLKVQGKKIGTVKALAKFDRNNLAQLISVLIDIQPIYVYWKVCPTQDGEPILKNTSAKSFTLFQHQLDPVVSTRYHATMKSSNAFEQVFDSDKAAEPPIKMFEHYFETPFEAIWRTLIADVWQDQHPAPINAGFAFADFLIEGMHQLLSRFQEIKAGREKQTGNVVMDTVSTYLNDPADSKANTAEECQRVWRERIETLMELYSWEELSIQLYGQMFPYRTAPVRFLPHIESSADISSYEFKDSKNHFQWSRYLSRGRSLFSTSTRNVGAASTATKTGDEIWIVAGSNFPFILRHLQNGHYELVGEAYVRGIMNGEALWVEDNPNFIDIILE